MPCPIPAPLSGGRQRGGKALRGGTHPRLRPGRPGPGRPPRLLPGPCRAPPRPRGSRGRKAGPGASRPVSPQGARDLPPRGAAREAPGAIATSAAGGGEEAKPVRAPRPRLSLRPRRERRDSSAAGSRPRQLPGRCLSWFPRLGREVSALGPAWDSPQVRGGFGGPHLKGAPVRGGSPGALPCRDPRERASSRRKLQLHAATWDSRRVEAKGGLPLVEGPPRPGSCLGPLRGSSAGRFASAGKELTSRLCPRRSSVVVPPVALPPWGRSAHPPQPQSLSSGARPGFSPQRPTPGEESLPSCRCLHWQAVTVGALMAGR